MQEKNNKGIMKTIIIIGFIILISIVIALLIKINTKESNCVQNVNEVSTVNNEKEYKGERYISLDKFNNSSPLEDNVKYIIKDFYVDDEKVNIEIDYYNSTLKINGNVADEKIYYYSDDPLCTYTLHEYFNAILLISYGPSGIDEIKIYSLDGKLKFNLDKNYNSDGIYSFEQYKDGETIKINKFLVTGTVLMQDQTLVSSLYPYCSDDNYNMADIKYNLIYNSDEEGYGFWELKIIDIECTYHSNSN